MGLSKVRQHTLVSGGVRGTLPWMAPELLSGKSNMVSEKVILYATIEYPRTDTSVLNMSSLFPLLLKTFLFGQRLILFMFQFSSISVLQIDVYSFGIVMWELLTGEEPYADMHCASIIGKCHKSLYLVGCE